MSVDGIKKVGETQSAAVNKIDTKKEDFDCSIHQLSTDCDDECGLKIEKNANSDDVENTKEPWQNLKDLIKEGKDDDSNSPKMVAEKSGFFGMKTGNYHYVADGKLTYGDLKDQLGLDNGVIRKNNPKLCEGIDGNADLATIPKGTKVKFNAKDLPGEPVGENGFYKSLVGNSMYYSVQSGDTQEGIYKKFEENKDILKGYKTADALRGYPDVTLQEGTKVNLPKKFLGLF